MQKLKLLMPHRASLLQDAGTDGHARRDGPDGQSRPDGHVASGPRGGCAAASWRRLTVRLSGAGSQLVASVLVRQIAALLIPSTEHDALDGLIPDQRIVHSGSMRVAVNHPADSRGLESRSYRCGVDVHDLRDGARGVGAAAGASLVGQHLPVRQRQAEEPALPGGRPDDAAQLLIGMIIGAKRIAVRQQHSLAVDLGNHGIG